MFYPGIFLTKIFTQKDVFLRPQNVPNCQVFTLEPTGRDYSTDALGGGEGNMPFRKNLPLSALLTSVFGFAGLMFRPCIQEWRS